MTYRQDKREVGIAFQQILLPDASVYSVQWLDVPAPYASRVTASFLMERYFKVVSECTCHLVRPAMTDDGVHFRLAATSLALLSFSPAQFHAEEGGEAVHLRISGGKSVRAGEGYLGRFSIISAASGDEMRITTQLSDYRPLLLGSRTPSKVRRLLYRLTQSYLHKVVTVRFLSRLYSELTGTEVRPRVNKVQLREGKEI